MLVELTVRNLAIIEETRLTFGPDLNVVTGETGTGKSLLIDALGFVLGGNSNRDLMRAGESHASVEAVFSIQGEPGTQAALKTLEVEMDDEELIVLHREVHREGRTVSRLNGRSVPVSVIRAVGDTLVDIHSQGSHLSLLDPQFQMQALDSFGDTGQQLEAVQVAIAQARRLQDELDQIALESRDAEQNRDLYAFQLEEIDNARISPDEEAALTTERNLLVHYQAIRAACSSAYEDLVSGESNTADLIAKAVLALRRAPDPNGHIRMQIAAIDSAGAEIEEAARQIRSFGDSVEHDPQRLEDIDQRIELIRRLKRKYGDTELQVLAFANAARAHLNGIQSEGEHRGDLELALESAYVQAGSLAWELSQTRQSIAVSLSASVQAELTEVGLTSVLFNAAITRSISQDGLLGPDGQRYAYSTNGIDEIEFRVQTNVGEEMKALAKIASGGETSRMMLALNSVLQTHSPVPTLIFDEIDTGIGARAGTVLGLKLWALARSGQVLCVTHLPQIAAFGDKHFRIAKSQLGSRTFATAQTLSQGQRLPEIAAMLGTGDSNRLSDAAREMLDGAERTKAAAMERGGLPQPPRS